MSVGIWMVTDPTGNMVELIDYWTEDRYIIQLLCCRYGLITREPIPPTQEIYFFLPTSVSKSPSVD